MNEPFQTGPLPFWDKMVNHDFGTLNSDDFEHKFTGGVAVSCWGRTATWV